VTEAPGRCEVLRRLPDRLLAAEDLPCHRTVIDRVGRAAGVSSLSSPSRHLPHQRLARRRSTSSSNSRACSCWPRARRSAARPLAEFRVLGWSSPSVRRRRSRRSADLTAGDRCDRRPGFPPGAGDQRKHRWHPDRVSFDVGCLACNAAPCVQHSLLRATWRMTVRGKRRAGQTIGSPDRPRVIDSGRQSA
jgi:hypothetical protein